jgi:hypothetical protein
LSGRVLKGSLTFAPDILYFFNWEAFKISVCFAG